MTIDLSQLAREIANEVISRLQAYEIQTHDTNELMSINEVATFLKLKPTTIYKMTNQGKIPILKINGGRIRFKKSEILTWLNNQTK